MSFDSSTLNSQNAPMRWRIAAARLAGRPDELAALGEEYKELMQYVYEKNFDAGGTAVPVAHVSFISRTANGVTFDLAPTGSGDSWDADYSLKAYDGTAPVAPTASTTLSVSKGKGTVSFATGDKPVAGKHVVFAFDVTDSSGESTKKTVEVVFAPPAAVITTVDGTDSTANVTFTAATGAASNVLYWKKGGTTATDVKTGTAIADYVSGVSIATGVGAVKFVLVSTNPDGSTDSNLGTMTVT